MAEKSDLEILSDLGVEPVRKTKTANTPREARIIAGFEDIQKFVEEHGRPPQHGEDRDIFERLYAVRLDRLRDQPECVELLKELDHQGLLTAPPAQETPAPSEMDDDALLATLGVDAQGESAITELKHVRPLAERRAADDIAVRHPCEDFEKFESIFAAVKADLREGIRQSRHFERKSEIEPGRFFIIEGLTVYVAEAGEAFINESGNRDMRLRVIFDNGTESNLLARSLQRALTQDPTGRRITEPSAGPLFDQEIEVEVEGSETGTIYVLRSRSDHPEIARNRELVHKIGVTGGDVERRIANAERDPTYLLAPVEIVATYKLIDINRTALENLLHRFFADARLDIAIPDRFGDRVEPREWFLVPLHVVDEVVRHVQDGTLHDYVYDLATASLQKPTRTT